MAELFAKNTISKSYQKELQAKHHGSNWGNTGYKYSGDAIRKVIEDRPWMRTALDYGCGKGSLAMMFAKLDWKEYDPGVEGKTELPNGTFDLVTCTDVMEHVERSSVRPVIKELYAKAGRVLFVDIACYATNNTFSEGPYKGQDLHITLEKPEWWLNEFDKCRSGGIQLAQSNIINKYSKGRYKERVQIVYERV